MKERDFHWYRLDANGYWSHKTGSARVTNLDNNKQTISNPVNADRGGYTKFHGFMYSDDNVVIAGKPEACHYRLLRYHGLL